MKKTKIGNLLGTIGVATGVFYSMKKGKGLGVTTLFAVGFGVVGLMLGNSLSKFYEN
jgi:uncharacterized membrane protein AbrB (regulator of aidB expression)